MFNTIIDSDTLPKKTQRNMKRTAASLDVKFGAPNFFHPLFQALSMFLPRDRRERNEWARHYYRTEPVVATALDIHTEFPISSFSNVCSEPKVKEFFDYLYFYK